MSVDRKEGRRKDRRAFRPTLDGSVGLESRWLMSRLPGAVFLKHPKIGVAFAANQPHLLQSSHAKPFKIATEPRGTEVRAETAHGGASVVVASTDGSHFLVAITQYFPNANGTTGTVTSSQSPIQGQTPGGGVIQPIGTVRAYEMSNGRVGLIVDGTTNQSELTISPYPFPMKKGYAHSFAYGEAGQTHVLNVGQLTINNGQLAAVEAFHTADLSGPLTMPGTSTVDRIAFDALLPGASIQTGGDLNTLDIYNGVNLNSGPGITVGRDLNLFNAGQNVNFSNGASLIVGRFLGAVPQPPKGTATGSNFLSLNQSLLGTGTSTSIPSLSAYIQGNLTLGLNSVISAPSGIANSSILGTTTSAPSIFLVNGSVTTVQANQIQIPNLSASTNFTQVVQTPTGVVTIFNNFVARNGLFGPTFAPSP